MPTIPPLDPAAESEAIRPVFDQLRATRGRVPTMYRVLAHQPDVLVAHRAYFHAALDTGDLGRALKEMVAFKAALVHGSSYSTASHRRYARMHGVPDEQLEAIERSDYRGFDGRERAALVFAEEVARAGTSVDGSSIDRLVDHFTSSEIVELAALVGIMQLAATLGALFDLVPDGDETGD